MKMTTKPEGLDVALRLNKDLVAAAKVLSTKEVRFLVDIYYQIQEQRIRSDNQIRSMEDTGEPNAVIHWYAKHSARLESEIKKALDKFSLASAIGDWMREHKGVGPVISAGLLAHIDINQAPTVGHIWRFAGLDCTQKWIGGDGARAVAKEVFDTRKDVTEQDIIACATASNRKPHLLKKLATDKDSGKVTRATLTSAMAKRPWNARLKVLCWKLGESFVKVSGHDDAYYGKIYAARKEQEVARNESGDFADQAAHKLETTNIGKATDAYKAYIEGRLPPAHIYSRAKRYAVKMFLSDLHYVWFKHAFQREPPRPYVEEHLGHVHIRRPKEIAA